MISNFRGWTGRTLAETRYSHNSANRRIGMCDPMRRMISRLE